MYQPRLTQFLARLALGVAGVLAGLAAQAETFVLPPPDVDLVGGVQVVYSKYEDTIMDIARRYGVGYDQIIKANPGVDRWIPGDGTPIVLPTRYILPNAPRDGLVLNVSEMRIYYYPKPEPGQKPVVITYPVSIGRMDWKTPLGKTSVISKVKDPPWYPPASIKTEHAREGDNLPDMIPGGSPDNPLGHYALYLGVRGYRIHGTDEKKSFGIGMRVTHGCVRLYPENIEQLYSIVPIGTPVYIVDQPVKAGWLADNLFLEVHTPLEEDELPIKVTVQDALKAVKARAKAGMPIDMEAVELVVEQGSGIPVPVARTVEQASTEPVALPASQN
jgi:L,D-transpeptidase ErfK/SrfK